jgi:23S rRNA (cytidine1920-2'-O)/16S rRNA (cytidine1409-2'-O)-methyltransferase
MSAKQRIDELLVEKKLVETRSQAKALIMAGQVIVNDERVDKAGQMVKVDSEIRLKNIRKYVSRGGLKLEKALMSFNISPEKWICLDVGASTGGFSDCLLKNKAEKVYAIDVGHSQLHHSLETNSQVISMEKTNFRHFDVKTLCDFINLVVMDVSFISIDLLLPVIKALFDHQGGEHHLITLVKPQFEAGKDQVGKGGIIRDVKLREQILCDKVKICTDLGFQNIQTTVSPIHGADGNEEFLIFGNYKTKS